ncbi:CBS domain-containing protein [Hydrocarboniclastica marina]|uniref:CBS domain-containing protein n=1 Tax=Hydrocarboniclastica marina TaxID=2259620 RepID=A0A4P7XKP0_9ALTE|nr:CBS domain-containing protein [Hydrocarboniclastica marina]MAM00361.1 CBS domain-containing protein [Alteromonadaceae bacterium]QCF27628.1 CBS domain-containing protein [Hydrocarboniclastica marina]
MQSVQVRDVMQRQVPTVTPNMPLTEVVNILLANSVSGLPVVDQQRQVIGFISEQDCIHALLVSSYHCEGDPEVGDVMFADPVVVSPADNMVDLAQNLGRGKPKVYPVAENGKLVGIITRSQILTKLARMGCGWGDRASA